MSIQFNQLKNADQTKNSTKPVFPSYHNPKRKINKFRVLVSIGLILATAFWGLAYYKFLNREPYSKYARNIDIAMVAGNSIRDPEKKVKAEFTYNENIFTQIKVKNGQRFNASIKYLNDKGDLLANPIKVNDISGDDTRYIAFDVLKYGKGKYATILNIDGKDYLQTEFTVK